MSFPSIPWPALLAGWGAIAAGLFLLQRLRVRHRELEVVTTLFWREAVEDTRARVFVRSFRHPWAYLLFLAVASLLWFAASGLRLERDTGEQHVLVLDGSAGAGWAGRFEAARELLLEDAAALPAERREVWWCGASARLLLRRGEHVRLLEERLAGLAPEAAPSRAEARLLAWAEREPEQATELRFYGDAPLRPEWLAALPDRAEVVRRAAEAAPRAGNRGFLSAGLAEAASGRWDRVDLRLELAGDPDGLAVSLDGQPAQLPFRRLPDAAGPGRAVLRFDELPARGQLLRLALPGGDGLAADDAVELVLPVRPPIRALLSPTLPEGLRALVASDPAVQVVEADAALVLRRAGESLGAGLPALELTGVAQSDFAFLVRGAGAGSADAFLNRVYRRLGFAEIDALSLASGLERPVRLGVETGAPAPAVVVWDAVMEPPSSFPSSRSYPLFVARCLRWLAGGDELLPVAAAGEGLESWAAAAPVDDPASASRAAWEAADGRRLEPVGAAFVPPAAGLYRGERGRLAVSLLDGAATLPLPAASLAAADPGAEGAGLPAWSWLVLLALALLLFEWHAFHRGRLP